MSSEKDLDLSVEKKETKPLTPAQQRYQQAALAELERRRQVLLDYLTLNPPETIELSIALGSFAAWRWSNTVRSVSWQALRSILEPEPVVVKWTTRGQEHLALFFDTVHLAQSLKTVLSSTVVKSWSLECIGNIGDEHVKPILETMLHVPKIRLHAGCKNAAVWKSISASKHLTEFELVCYQEEGAFALVGQYLRRHPTIRKVSIVPELKGEPPLKESLVSIIQMMADIESIPNLSYFEFWLANRIEERRYNPQEYQDLANRLFSILSHPKIHTAKLRSELWVGGAASRTLAKILTEKNISLSSLHLGCGYSYAPKLLFEEEASPAIVNALIQADPLTCLEIHSETFLTGDAVEEKLLFFRYFAQTQRLTTLELKASGGALITTFTILRALTKNQSLKKVTIRFNSGCLYTTRRSVDFTQPVSALQALLDERFGLKSLDGTNPINCLFDVLRHNSHLEELTILSRGSQPWAGVHKQLQALIHGGYASTLRRLEWRNYEVDELNGNSSDCLENVKGWVDVLRNNACLQFVGFDPYAHPREPDNETFEPRSDDTADEEWETVMEEWEEEMERSKELKQEFDYFQSELEGWLALNEAMGSIRRQFLQDPRTITKEQAVDLLITSSNVPSCSYQQLRLAPDVFFSNSAEEDKKKPSKKLRVT